jgi:hypothetical protein
MACRLHRVDESAGPAADLDYLTQLAQRVKICQKSMTHGGPARTPDSDAALVEAIGWASGWHPELALRTWSQ